MHEWLGSARRDLAMGLAGLDLTMESYEGVSFHAQQAPEKALKALLVWHQVILGEEVLVTLPVDSRKDR